MASQRLSKTSAWNPDCCFLCWNVSSWHCPNLRLFSSPWACAIQILQWLQLLNWKASHANPTCTKELLSYWSSWISQSLRVEGSIPSEKCELSSQGLTQHMSLLSQVTLGWDWRQCLETVLVLRQQNNVPETKPLPALYLSYISVSTLSVSDKMCLISEAQWKILINLYWQSPSVTPLLIYPWLESVYPI